MKRLAWKWKLPHGETVEARIELPAKSETVSLDGKVVSQTDAPKSDGHIVPLAGEGAYRGAREVKVVFDTVGDAVANAVLTIDGAIVRPEEAPASRWPRAIPVVVGALSLAAGIFVVVALVAREPAKPPTGEGPAAMVLAGPVESTSPMPLPTNASRVVADLNVPFQTCWHNAPLADKVGGYIEMMIDISKEGVVDGSSILVNGPGPAVSKCVGDAVKSAHFARTEERSSLRFRVAFVVVRVTPY